MDQTNASVYQVTEDSDRPVVDTDVTFYCRRHMNKLDNRAASTRYAQNMADLRTPTQNLRNLLYACSSGFFHLTM